MKNSKSNCLVEKYELFRIVFDLSYSFSFILVPSLIRCIWKAGSVMRCVSQLNGRKRCASTAQQAQVATALYTRTLLCYLNIVLDSSSIFLSIISILNVFKGSLNGLLCENVEFNSTTLNSSRKVQLVIFVIHVTFSSISFSLKFIWKNKFRGFFVLYQKITTIYIHSRYFCIESY